MNDTMSLVLATGILAIGGLGLYMYKNTDLNTDEGEVYDEYSLFGEGGFFGGNNDDNDNDNNDENYDVVEEVKKKVRGARTKRARKSSGTKRRY